MKLNTEMRAARVGMFRGPIQIVALNFCLTIAVVTGFAQLPSIPPGYINIELQEIVTGLHAPVKMAYPNDGTNRLFIVEQGGKIRLYKDGVLQPGLFLDLTAQVAVGGETGLLGLAFHPDFNVLGAPGYHKLYTYQSEPAASPAPTPDFPPPAGAPADHHNIVTEWQIALANPDAVDPATRRDVLRAGAPGSSHNGAEISFRPSDGYLYMAFGDGSNPNNAQDITNVFGDVLRIDPILPALTPASADPVSANGKYRIPATNPFIGAIPGADEVYASGFRNPYRFSFDGPTDRFILGDVGQTHIEEIDIIESGGNYGWNQKEGTFLYHSADESVSPDPNPDPALKDPVAQYDHEDGHAVVGGFVYHGTAIPALIGKYVFGDYIGKPTGGRLFSCDLATGKIQELLIGVPNRDLGGFLKGLGQDQSGELYVLTDEVAASATGGKVRKLVPIVPSVVLANLSTRANIGTNDNVLIGGFIVTGSSPKVLMLRALGPSLLASGQSFPGRLSDPVLELHGSDGSLLDTNDNWGDASNAQQIADSGLAPGDSLESAILTSPLTPGTYTAIARGNAGATGIGLVELYDVDQNAPANAVNISARGNVGTGDNVMIGGFIIDGSQSRTVVIRALGPSLTGAGVPDALQNPRLEIHNDSGALIASNDDWQTPAPNGTQVSATGLAPSNVNEPALVQTLAPGGYTAIVVGVNNTIGIALIEIYYLP
jgi:glucose/arabinose dehydrogenase